MAKDTKKTTSKKDKPPAKTTALAKSKKDGGGANLAIPVEFLNSKSKIIAKYTAPHATGTQIIRSALLAFEEDWKLQKALETERGRNSVYHAMLRAASTGLSLNPLEGKAALVPYSSKNNQTGEWETTVTYQIMKNGIIELALLSGQVEHVSADTIRENDSFEIEKTGSGDSFKFSPALTGRGEIVGVYASVKMKSGDSNVSYMSWDEIEEHRDRYSSSYKYDQKEKSKKSPWSHSAEGMAIKTVLKKLFRNIFISPEVNRAVTVDDQSEGSMVIDVEPQKTSGAEDIAKQLHNIEAAALVESEKGEVVEEADATVDRDSKPTSKAGF